MNVRLALSSSLLLAVVGFVALLVVLAVRRRSVPVGRHGVIDAFRLVTSAPAFFVPAAMTAVAVVLWQSLLGVAGANPFSADNAEHLFARAGALALCAGGLAGHVGLLEAHRAGRPVGADAFLDGIRRYTATLVVAELAVGGAVMLALMIVGPFENRFTPYVLPKFPDAVRWLVVFAPGILLAPVLGTAALHQGRPLAALTTAAVTTLRHPGRVLVPFALQVGIVALGLGLLGEHVRRLGPQLHAFTVTEVSPLGFLLYPFAVFAGSEDGLALMVPIVACSPVFLTAYWSLTAEVETRGRPAPSTTGPGRATTT